MESGSCAFFRPISWTDCLRTRYSGCHSKRRRPLIDMREVLTTVRHGSTWFVIFFHTVFTHAHILSALHLALQFTHAAVFVYGYIFAAFHSLRIHTRRCSRIRSHFPAFSLSQHSHKPLFSHTVAFSLLLLAHCILTSRPCPHTITFSLLFALSAF